MKNRLSQRQQRILEFIQKFMDEHQYPPTVRDIQNGCEVSSTSVVDYNLRKLQEMGYLTREPEVSRGIELVGEGLRGSKRDIQSIPIMGSIAAGRTTADPRRTLVCFRQHGHHRPSVVPHQRSSERLRAARQGYIHDRRARRGWRPRAGRASH